ncbi:hypothetical protein M405DRAFT_847515 [Rhizopogon salebrosus TDB-379]|nr:hypothetical protein M405DRAFT_847515 [Rhizopogon salebrosus TDB-379]
MSMNSDYFQNAPAGQYANQESSRFALDSLQDLTNEIQGRPPFATASGGFWDIWKCYLVKSDGTVEVAVKSIRAFESDDSAKISRKARRVHRELKVWGRLKHDCILPLWGVADNFGPYPAMVCSWVDNGALTVYLERHEDSLLPQDKFSILSDIALGLQYPVKLSTECDIYSFGSIFLQVLTCKIPYHNVKKDNIVLRQVIRGKKPEPPKELVLAPAHWEFIQRSIKFSHDDLGIDHPQIFVSKNPLTTASHQQLGWSWLTLFKSSCASSSPDTTAPSAW